MEEFWKVINVIDWSSHYNYNIAKERLNDYVNNNPTFSLDQFEDNFSMLESKINDETITRVNKKKRVFAEGISHGADDCHFMDMPAHLIGLGELEVNQYLSGGLINFEPEECLSYMFHGDENE